MRTDPHAARNARRHCIILQRGLSGTKTGELVVSTPPSSSSLGQGVVPQRGHWNMDRVNRALPSNVTKHLGLVTPRFSILRHTGTTPAWETRSIPARSSISGTRPQLCFAQGGLQRLQIAPLRNPSYSPRRPSPQPEPLAYHLVQGGLFPIQSRRLIGNAFILPAQDLYPSGRRNNKGGRCALATAGRPVCRAGKHCSVMAPRIMDRRLFPMALRTLHDTFRVSR
jgi:hypothetical protein